MEHTIEKDTSITIFNSSSKENLYHLIRHYGSASSISYLDCPYKFFSTPSITGCIGYRIAFGCAIVMGEPLCEEDKKLSLARAFQDFCQKGKTPIIYITTSKSFALHAHQKIVHSIVEAADELIFNPQNDPKKGSKGRLLRGKVSQAIRFGITTHEYKGVDSSLEEKLEEVGSLWLKGRQGPQIYLAPVDLFSMRDGKRWIYAVCNDQVVGVALLHEIKARSGWLLQLILTIPEAPNGTSELLVTTCIDILRAEGCQFLSFGAAPRKELGIIKGFGSFSTFLARVIYKGAKRAFPLDGRRKFWQKFSPESEGTFVLFERKHLSLKEVGAIMKSLNVSL